MADPASIRTNNPGAQWIGPVAREFGATDAVGLPGGNNAAVFPDPVAGAAAQFALLGRNYANMPLSDAISKWSGGNSSQPYVDFLTKHGVPADTVLTPEFLAGPGGLQFAKAQAHWEAGKPYPMSDEQWSQAQAKALGGSPSQESGPLGANAMGQAQVAPSPYFAPAAAAPTSPQGNLGAGLESQGMAMLSPKLPDMPKMQLPPAWRPKIAPGINLATIKPFFPKG